MNKRPKARVDIRPARPGDIARLDAIRVAAFAPVFASFRAIMGKEIYELAQKPGDDAQGGLMRSMMAGENGWTMYVALVDETVAGFMAVQINRETKVGEIGLNAVDPVQAGRGIGTTMYRFALARMKEAGLRVATVSTGGDPSHAPARRAYRKVGFDMSFPSVWMCRTL